MHVASATIECNRGAVERMSTLPGLLGDTTSRDYSRKLRLFNAFAEPELRHIIASLNLRPGARVLDAGCGTGEVLRWFRDEVGPEGVAVGIDLARAHATAARASAPSQTPVLQADLLKAPFRDESFDLVWCMNTINHLRDPVAGVERLASLLRPAGRVALCQSSLLPDMYFAWDARLERMVNEAVRQYYRDRYGVSERDLAAVRSLVGVLRQAQLRNVRAQTFAIERVSPLGAADEAYLVKAIFHNTWGARLQPYLSSDDYGELARLCDPQHPQFAPRRPDFHFLQTFTVVVGER